MNVTPLHKSKLCKDVIEFKRPTIGSIVRTHFPNVEGVDPNNPERPKPRPGLIVGIDDKNNVIVVYGTTQRTSENELYDTELVIRNSDRDYCYTGLAHDTKFNFEREVKLPFNSEYFSIPRSTSTKTYTCPRIGILPVSYYDNMKKAANNAQAKLRKAV
ncbi:TPA: hypothetical protein ACF5RG_003564 [Providencia alcalifaciens]